MNTKERKTDSDDDSTYWMTKRCTCGWHMIKQYCKNQPIWFCTACFTMFPRQPKKGETNVHKTEL